MNIGTGKMKDILVFEPQVHGDHRGFFLETWNEQRYRKAGISNFFVQDNLSFSVCGTLRGLHFQISNPQAKLIQVITGEVFDVAVDIRPGSPTFGQWEGFRLSEFNRRQVYIPEGFAHGFCVTSATAHFHYKCTCFYDPKDEGGISWSDPDLGIDWPVKNPIVSDKDKCLPRLSALSPSQLYQPGRKP
jgi:dTDP-4-dehydrorhamnose 3,5-epimerase